MSDPMDIGRIRKKLEGASGRKYWRSLEEIAETPEFQDFLRHEFPENADQWGDGVSRRRFLQLMSASFALAGLAACTKQPDEKIVPYNEQPEALIPGKPLYFATCLPWRGFARGAVVESHEGRPTKIEGNPLHPATPGGGTDAFMQASVLSLYDPERARAVTREGTISSWESFTAAMAAALESETASGGAGLRILTGTVTSPTLAGQLAALVRKFPNARWLSYDPVSRDGERAGTRAAFGRDLDFSYRFDRADVVLSLDGDFLSGGPASVRYASDFASRRRVGGDRPPCRLYAVESTPTLAGAVADHRVALRSCDIEQVPRAVAGGIGVPVKGNEPGTLPAAALNWIAAATKDLAANRGASLVVAGEGQSASCHAAAHVLNHALGNTGRTVVYTEPVEATPSQQLGSLRELVDEMRADKVMVLVVLASNPVYTAPADWDFRGALEKVATTVRVGLSEDETSRWCRWNIPLSHPLESWSDARAFDGTVSIQQPLIEPLYKSKSEHEVLAMMLGSPDASSHDVVKEHWRSERPAEGFDDFWNQSLRDGVVANTRLPELTVAPVLAALPALSSKPPDRDVVEIVFRPDPTVWDGELANNGWLQELPKPLTRLTWDNAALLSPAMAAERGLKEGDIVELALGGRKVIASALPVPGHAEGSITAHLGYGRTRVGSVGRNTGFDAYTLRTASAPSFAPGLEIRKTGGRWQLATTQHHSAMEGRHLVRAAALPVYQKNPRFAQELSEDPGKDDSLYPAFPDELPSKEYAWGMAVDLSTCIGCAACVVACQAENNSPIVGKDQVARGREMHWIRIDRYYSGSERNPETFFEPVMCMHCEKAPCEVVCPVGATVHSVEGLNEMVYNRCVGTRYCSNNCPYKVRRFNFLQYNDPSAGSLKLLRNPNVTVRSRGVMEKCSFCVQRISAARIEAEKRGTPIRDGEVKTACQQACPAQALVFGNIHDPESRVAKMKATPLNYGLMTELNTRPRTTYLAKVWNPNPELGEERG